jgi:hypothetical protein
MSENILTPSAVRFITFQWPSKFRLFLPPAAAARLSYSPQRFRICAYAQWRSLRTWRRLCDAGK